MKDVMEQVADSAIVRVFSNEVSSLGTHSHTHTHTLTPSLCPLFQVALSSSTSSAIEMAVD